LGRICHQGKLKLVGLTVAGKTERMWGTTHVFGSVSGSTDTSQALG
jgi:hypothetical protein